MEPAQTPASPGSTGTLHRVPSTHGHKSDHAVQQTNDDAAMSKLSAVKMGYVRDDLVQCFVRRAQRRPPIINRGYWARYGAVTTLLRRFMALGGPGVRKQVVSLGAGFDTTFFHLRRQNATPAAFLEIDFPEVCVKKKEVISRHEEMRGMLGPDPAQCLGFDGGEIHGEGTTSWGGPAARRAGASLEAAVAKAGLDAALPTLVLAECVLVYLPPAASEAVLAWAARSFRTAAFVAYEMYKPNDPFGATMVSNLQERGCALLGIAAYPDEASQIDRYLRNGWATGRLVDMLAVYEECLDVDEIRRVERLEIFDELEEWRLMLSHYFVSWATRDEAGTGLLHGFGFDMHPPVHGHRPPGRPGPGPGGPGPGLPAG
eukprot:tig00020614_g12125.t1